MSIYIGCDPGKTGAITIMQTSPDDEVRLLNIHMMPQTEQGIKNIFENLIQPKYSIPEGFLNKQNMVALSEEPATIVLKLTETLPMEFGIKAIIESQHAFPGMGAGAQWTFAQHYGFLRGVLVALQIPFIEVAPQTWMNYFGFRRNKDEDKKKHKLRILQKAQNLYPHSSVALQTADSLMLCHYLYLTEGRSEKIIK
ncbi:hypothetical protein [Immundisolibacter sp.]